MGGNIIEINIRLEENYMKNILIEGTGAYIPNNKVYNEQLDEHFEKRGLSAHSLMEHLGRRKRYFISDDETTITMCIEAIDDCISKHHLNLDEYEMLIVCTDTPEYLFPSNAMRIAGLYGEKMKNIKVAFDLNSNCTGMIQGLDVVYKYMQTSDITKALVVGSFCISPIALWSDTVVYATFADAAACVALKADEAIRKKGFIDTVVSVNASYHDYIKYPKCGMAKVPLQAIMPNEKRLEWNPFPMDFIPKQWENAISQILNKNELTANDIDYYIFSQLSDVYNMETLRLLGLSEEDNKYFFVGKEYGYTGNTCPILCLNRLWDIYSKEGTKIIICTVGAGYSIIAQLYEF